MSTIRKNYAKKHKKRKFKVISKIVFMFCMVLNLMLCIIIIDNNAKKMLGEETYDIETIVNRLNNNIKEVFSSIPLKEIKDNIVKTLN